ncbi:MAG: alpha/beta fold hydrolase [Planctomycetota bacterium]|jgi:pimeloyl-ACP methyl ester carboxylesterase
MRRLYLIALAAACAAPAKHVSEQRLDDGYTAIMVGIFGNTPAYDEMEQALVEGGLPGGVEVVDWTLGEAMFLANMRASARNRRQAREFAAMVVNYQDDHPGRPVHLIGHSGGGGFVLMVLEELSEGRKVTAAVLLSPAVHPDYDLTKALGHVKLGLFSAYSEKDDVYLGVGTHLIGTYGGKPSNAAGLVGFRRPRDLDAAGRRLYERKLRQLGWTEAMEATGHTGGHWGWMERRFVLEYLAPPLTASAEGRRPTPHPDWKRG